jgi:predicted cupin superfamily sugar epimerase
MHTTVENLIRQLDMQPHPEGGFYRETYRSNILIHPLERCAMTVIYFLLTSSDVSRFHRIKSDEFWFFHAGSPLTIHTLSENGYKTHLLGLTEGSTPQLMIPAHVIFGATVEQKNSYSLVSCAVAPGFDFEDFKLFSREELMSDFPEQSAIISRLT